MCDNGFYFGYLGVCVLVFRIFLWYKGICLFRLELEELFRVIMIYFFNFIFSFNILKFLYLTCFLSISSIGRFREFLDM